MTIQIVVTSDVTFMLPTALCWSMPPRLQGFSTFLGPLGLSYTCSEIILLWSPFCSLLTTVEVTGKEGWQNEEGLLSSCGDPAEGTASHLSQSCKPSKCQNRLPSICFFLKILLNFFWDHNTSYNLFLRNSKRNLTYLLWIKYY